MIRLHYQAASHCVTTRPASPSAFGSFMWSNGRKIALNGCVGVSILVGILWIKNLFGSDFLYVPVGGGHFIILESTGGGLAISSRTAPRPSESAMRVNYLYLRG